MPERVLPMSIKKTTTLREDDDQNDLDSIFFVSLFLYSVYVTLIPWIYDEKDAIAVNNFHLIISNFFGVFAVLQAQGMWLKSLLMMTIYFSMVWHWTSDLNLPLPHDEKLYGRGDSILSILTIISYCLSWIPKFKVYQPTEEEEKKLWYKYFRGSPKQTGEWRCRCTLNLMVNVFICIIFGVILYLTAENENSQDIQITICWAFIFIALVSGFYQLYKKERTIATKKKKKFVFWLSIGTLYGIVGFLQKVQHTVNSHIFWHVYVMATAYSFSRTAEYLEINKN